MTDSEILERAERYIGIHYINGVEDLYIDPCLLRAIKSGAAALREKQERGQSVPLTLEELRGMDGEPVWVNVADGRWGLVDLDAGEITMSGGWGTDIQVLIGQIYRCPPEP